jgi:hypothetical protein
MSYPSTRPSRILKDQTRMVRLTPQRKPRARSHRSAKAAGTRHETNVVRYLAAHLDDRIERRARNGAKDRGDISGIRLPVSLGGGRVVAELKDRRDFSLSQWYRQADIERGNDDAVVGLIIHKRHGVAAPGQQWVTSTVDDLIALLSGARPVLIEPDE